MPREIKRGFSRLAGLLELADSEFVRLRDAMNDYTADIHEKIVENKADNVGIDMISLNEYMRCNKEMRKFISALAGIENSEISEVNPEAYIEQLMFLGIDTLGGLQNMLETCGKSAYEMAKKTLEGTELDILSSNVALRFLCRAYLIKNDYTSDKMEEFFMLSVGDKSRAEKQAKRLLDIKNKM